MSRMKYENEAMKHDPKQDAKGEDNEQSCIEVVDVDTICVKWLM